MAYQASILSQIVRQVNRREFQDQVSKYHGDFKVSKLNCFSLLVAMIYTHLKTNRTLRDLAIGFATAASHCYHLGVRSMRRSTLADALAHRPARVYEEFYYQLLASLNRGERRRLGLKVHLIDSTTIGLCLERFEWAKYRKRKGGLKLHVLLDSETHLAEQVSFTNAGMHDLKAIRGKIEFQRGEMYVYDRAYACYNYLYRIELAGAYFVTRCKSNWKVRAVKNRPVPAGARGVKKDQLIRVSGGKREEYPHTLRRVTFYHEESGQTLEFLTNHVRLSAAHIAEIYKRRWQIELFFKWMKQHLKIKTFLSTSVNGVKIQIWCALITYVLLHLLQSRLLVRMEVFDLYRRVQDQLFSRLDLYELLTQTVPKKMREDGQQELKYA